MLSADYFNKQQEAIDELSLLPKKRKKSEVLSDLEDCFYKFQDALIDGDKDGMEDWAAIVAAKMFSAQRLR